MFCRGDWYAQGNHARDAASRRRPGDDEGIGPHRQVGTFVYSSPELCLPFRTITSLSTEDRGILPHSPGTYKPPQKNTQKHEKCDSGCENAMARRTSAALLRRLFERGDHARDARLHLAHGRGGEIHPPGDLRAVVAGREELAVDPPRLLGYRRPREDMLDRSTMARKVPCRHVVGGRRDRRRGERRGRRRGERRARRARPTNPRPCLHSAEAADELVAQHRGEIRLELTFPAHVAS